MFDLRGRTALVTGGASGIGLATVTRFARSGARVALDHLPGDPAGPEAAARLLADGLDVTAIAGDVADPDAAPAMVTEAAARLGRLDFLVNGAGTPATPTPIPFPDLDALADDIWAATLGTNLVGAFRCVRAAAPYLRSARGAVVNVASVAAFGGGAGSSLAYAASKAGLVNLTRNLARALAPDVRVNAVAPGLIETPWTAPWPEAHKRATIDRTWLARAGRPDDVAEVILFLCAAASFVTGETLAVDGGRPR